MLCFVVGLDICSRFVPKYSGLAYTHFRQEMQSQESNVKLPQEVSNKRPKEVSNKRPKTTLSTSMCVDSSGMFAMSSKLGSLNKWNMLNIYLYSSV